MLRFSSTFCKRITTRDAIANRIGIRGFATERAKSLVKPGNILIVDGKPHRVKDIQHGKRGKGGAFVRATLHNMITQQIFEKTFLVDDQVEDANIEQDRYNYSWNDGGLFNFLHSTTFDECVIAKDQLPDHDFLVEGMEVKVQKFQGKVITVILPQQHNYKVIEKSQNKAVLESGAEIIVPDFVKVGETIRVDIPLRQYVEKVN